MYAARSLERRGFGRGWVIGLSAVACGTLCIAFARHSIRALVASYEDVRKPMPADVSNGDRSLQARQPNSLEVAAGAPVDGAFDLTHDFGVVSPGAALRWTFPVRNDSDVAWSVDKFAVTCDCTTPHVSFTELRPGEQGTVTIALRCDSNATDMRRSVILKFSEANVSPIRFTLDAAVRSAMTPDTTNVIFSGLIGERAADRDLVLMNYSNHDWSEVRIEGSPTWVTATVSASKPRDESTGCASATIAPQEEERFLNDSKPNAKPRQVWSAVISVAADSLPDGYHQAPLVFRADTGDCCEVIVRAHVRAKGGVPRAGQGASFL